MPLRPAQRFALTIPPVRRAVEAIPAVSGDAVFSESYQADLYASMISNKISETEGSFTGSPRRQALSGSPGRTRGGTLQHAGDPGPVDDLDPDEELIILGTMLPSRSRLTSELKRYGPSDLQVGEAKVSWAGVYAPTPTDRASPAILGSRRRADNSGLSAYPLPAETHKCTALGVIYLQSRRSTY